jgi:hypothetical protein
MNRNASSLTAVILAGLSASCGSPGPSESKWISRGPVELVGEPSRPLFPVAVAPEPDQPSQPLAAVAGCPTITQALRVLVLSADGNEVDLPAITQALGYHSVPYTVWIASQKPGQLTAAALATGCAGAYQGVILATAALVPDGGSASALTASEWLALRTYEAGFGVRELAWYAFPGADQGLTSVGSLDTSSTPLAATWTTAGAKLFSSLVPTAPISIAQSWVYLATVADPSVTVLLSDAAGHALASVRTFTDGRQVLTLTFDSNPYLRHALLLGHGLVEWVTRGIYLGAFRAYLTPQIDDLFIEDDLYPAGSGTYRMTAADMNGAASWLTTTQRGAGNSALKLAWAYNGEGGNATTDPLTLAAKANASRFLFINHTWDHANLDGVQDPPLPNLPPATYAEMLAELSQNQTFSRSAGFSSPQSGLVTPDVSGLLNSEALRAAAAFGVRWMVSDTSRVGWDNPVPNVGIQSALQPLIYFVPRRPTNLFYNVSTQTEWVAEYNAFYATYWGKNLTYTEMLDKESEVLLQYMLRGEIDPHMYHQANLRLYDGSHSLLSDLLNAVLAKYRAFSTLPVSSPDMATAGGRMKAIGTRNAATFTAYRTPGVGVTLSSPVALQVSLSGACTTGSEVYAGKCITTVNLAPNRPVLIRAP